ncbi:hypothetical protein [Actinocorallia lasiicapitis]
MARDRAMEVAWDDAGYGLSDGEGPFALYYEPFLPRTRRIQFLEDPYQRDGFRFLPYEAGLVGSGLWLVTVITPDSSSLFSRGIIDAVISSLGHVQEGA